MRKIARSAVAYALMLAARGVVHRYRPTVVMVTGSVGKTSTKDAVAAALSARYFVRKSQKSYNSEFGVPFTILGVENPWENPIKWLLVVKSALALLVLPNHYPNLLVLEVGADYPGDLAKILRIATPDAVVVTRLPDIPVHVEAYASPEAVREEEFSPALALAANAPLIIPADDPYAIPMSLQTPARIISYGYADDAMIRVADVGFLEREGKVVGMKADAFAGGSKIEITAEGSVGRTQILPLAAALAAAHSFGIPLEEAAEALKSYEPPPGRGRIFAGRNGSVIIDDSYNASPAAVAEALETLKAFPDAKRRIAVLGDMLELGRYSVMEHQRIGALAGECVDLIASVGVRARAFATVPADPKVLPFDNSRAAAEGLKDFVQAGDIVLVKGSQSVRTERIVEALLAHPKDAERLVRQEHAWKQKS